MLDIARVWYRNSLCTVSFLLLPFSYLFALIIFLRRLCFRLGIFKVHHLNVPVIVVGNITVGGTGKTPFAIWLAKLLIEHGYTPGIVSHGYGGIKSKQPFFVSVDSSALQVGDEALLLKRHTLCPVVIAADRVAAAKALLAQHTCDVIISDDGLQHYHLGRDIEIAIIDGIRQFGNHYLLPAGPLREPIARLNSVDLVVKNDGDIENKWGMTLMPEFMVSLQTKNKVKLADFAANKIHAVAAIGHPQRFFQTLKEAGFDLIIHTFPDHYQYKAEDLQFADNFPVVMTEKDAVKCYSFAQPHFWYLAVTAHIGKALPDALLKRLQTIKERK